MNERIATLFHEVLQLPPKQRQAYLEQECAKVPGLLQKIKSLLAADAAAQEEAYLETSLAQIPHIEEFEPAQSAKSQPPANQPQKNQPPANQPPANRPPKNQPPTNQPPKKLHHVGPYRLGTLLGEGSMGKVFIGHRDDGTYEQQVAIKIMHRGFNSQEHIERFRAEQQILASLKHQHIAQLLDGGVIEDGRPYLVMELVEGQPITEYCDHNQLNITQRLHLFAKVCSAVQIVHQRLTVHRNIKPENILVTPQEIPKVLDFGITKSFEPEHTNAPMDERREAAKLTTLAYAAPEQVKEEPVTTATDVYALGILLCELLAGVRPYDFSGLSMYEIEQRICDASPTRPSAVLSRQRGISAKVRKDTEREIGEARSTTHKALTKQIDGDLDHIVLMAIRKEPDRRYGSPAQLSEDISRFLSHHPIDARIDAPNYRTSKFFLRNRLPLAVGAFLFLLIAGFSIREFNLRKTADEALSTVRKEAVTSEALASFMINLFDVAEPSSNQAMRIDTLRVRDFLLQRGATIRSIKDQPEVKVRALGVVGNMYYTFGDYDEARALIEESVALADSLYAMPHKDVIEIKHRLAELEKIQGAYDKAIKYEKEALAEVLLLDPSDDLLHASILNSIGDVLRIQEQFAEAEEYLRQGYDMRIALTGERSLETAHSANNLGLALYHQNRNEEAEAMFATSIAAYREQVGNTNTNVSASLNNLALVKANNGDLAGAIRLAEESVDIQRAIFGNRHWRVAHGTAN
ncbi:MAG: protein kinase, partial [Rhodothermales bacterium]